MTPHAVYIDERAVSVQWDDRGPFVTLHEDGTVTEQWREPRGARVLFEGDVEWPDNVNWPTGYVNPASRKGA